MMPLKNGEAGTGEVKHDLLATHFCCCKPGVPCVFCLRWDRAIRGIEQRQSDALRLQANAYRVAWGVA